MPALIPVGDESAMNCKAVSVSFSAFLPRNILHVGSKVRREGGCPVGGCLRSHIGPVKDGIGFREDNGFFERGTCMLRVAIAGLLVGFLPLLFLRTEPVTATVRPGFEDRLVALVDQPIGLTFTPDGRMLVISKGGTFWVSKEGRLL